MARGESPFGSRVSSRQLCTRVGGPTLRCQALGRLQWAHCTGLQVCFTCRQLPRQPDRIVLLLLTSQHSAGNTGPVFRLLLKVESLGKKAP